MGMLQRLSHDLRAGWVTLRHGTAKAATRALEEGELLGYRLNCERWSSSWMICMWTSVSGRSSCMDRGEAPDRIVL